MRTGDIRLLCDEYGAVREHVPALRPAGYY